MEIAGIRAIEKFKKVHPAARHTLEDWVTKVTAVTWRKPADIKGIFSTASFVKHHVIFNVGGNKYRLLTEVRYETGRIIVLQIGTHEEFDRWKL